ncbi:MAG TPA: universal stress protein [Bacteroidia bacterium]|jgi:nucleotide-binding universal stress UspA family protein|nr:universal stress protein [Bacteroidia bacterium]
MATIKNILIPTDFSETANLAVAHGANMAHLFNAKMFLLHSVEPFTAINAPGEPALVMEAENMYNDGVAQLKKVASEITQKYNVDITTITVNGKPAAAISEAVKDNNIDIIVMGTHGASGFEEFFIGSNTHKVVNLATCPVISIQATSKNVGFSNIVAPISNSTHSRQKINNIIELASKYNSTVHLLGLLETNDPVDAKKFDIKLESVENMLKKANIKFTKKLVHGHNPAVEAMKFSEEVNGDLIVIMTDHESDLTGMFLGTVAKQIVNHSKIPVMSIRPIASDVEAFDPAGGTGEIL